MASSSANKPSLWFVFQNDQLLLVKTEQSYSLIDSTLLAELKPHLLRELIAGEFNQTSCYCGEIANDIHLPAQIEMVTIRKAFQLLDQTWYRPIIQSYSIINWDRNHQYCGHCGYPTQPKVGVYERVCLNCGLAHFPRISPSMIVLISRGDELLLARSPHFSPGVFGLIAGFVEVGETIEETVHREVKEEVNLQITNLRYFGSQAWPFPNSLMIGFFADYASGEIEIDHKEIELAGWYRFDNLPGLPNVGVSIARRMIEHFVDTKKK